MRSYSMLLTALCVATPLLAQEPVDLTFTLEDGGKEAGREHVVISPVRSGATSGRIQIDARNRAAREDFRATLTRTGSTVDGLVLDIRGPAGTLVVRAANRGGRVFISTTGEGARGGRELPGGANVIFVDSALHTLILPVVDLATPEGTKLSAIYVRTGNRVDFAAKRVEGGGRTTVELSGGLSGQIKLDKDGLVEEMTLGSRRLVRSRT